MFSCSYNGLSEQRPQSIQTASPTCNAPVVTQARQGPTAERFVRHPIINLPHLGPGRYALNEHSVLPSLVGQNGANRVQAVNHALGMRGIEDQSRLIRPQINCIQIRPSARKWSFEHFCGFSVMVKTRFVHHARSTRCPKDHRMRPAKLHLRYKAKLVDSVLVD